MCLSESDENPYTWSGESGFPRGKALGGTSVLHFGMYVRGRPRDFDGWGIPGWGYREMLRAFKKSEDFKVWHFGKQAYIGTIVMYIMFLVRVTPKMQARCMALADPCRWSPARTDTPLMTWFSRDGRSWDTRRVMSMTPLRVRRSSASQPK